MRTCPRPTRSSSPCPTVAAAARPGDRRRRRHARSISGPTSACAIPADYPRWYGFEHPHPELLEAAVYGLPELHRAGARGTPRRADPDRRRAGLLPDGDAPGAGPAGGAGLIGDLVVDAKSGVSGAGREPKAGAPLRRGQRERPGVRRRAATATSPRSSRSWRRSRRAPAWWRREPGRRARRLRPAPRPDDARHPRDLPRPPDADRRARLSSTDCTPRPTPTSRSSRSSPRLRRRVRSLGSNYARVHVRADERTGPDPRDRRRSTTWSRAPPVRRIQAFNLVHGLPETLGLEQLPLAP